MSVDINHIVVTGRLTRDPQSVSDAVTKFSIAVNGRVHDKANGEWTDTVDFFDVTVLGFSAKACAEHLTKGSRVAVDGNLKLERWKNKEGQARSAIRILTNRVLFLDGKERSGVSGGQGVTDERFSDADIPF